MIIVVGRVVLCARSYTVSVIQTGDHFLLEHINSAIYISRYTVYTTAALHFNAFIQRRAPSKAIYSRHRDVNVYLRKHILQDYKFLVCIHSTDVTVDTVSTYLTVSQK